MADEGGEQPSDAVGKGSISTAAMTDTLRELLPIPATEIPAEMRDAAIRLAELQRVYELCISAPGGAVLRLKLTDEGWRFRYWEPVE